jgi:hypothetical protein
LKSFILLFPYDVILPRAGYTPDDYPTESEWSARELIEYSAAVKCPNISYHLAGTKKVQQVLANPSELEKFMNPEECAQLRQVTTPPPSSLLASSAAIFRSLPDCIRWIQRILQLKRLKR